MLRVTIVRRALRGVWQVVPEARHIRVVSLLVFADGPPPFPLPASTSHPASPSATCARARRAPRDSHETRGAAPRQDQDAVAVAAAMAAARGAPVVQGRWTCRNVLWAMVICILGLVVSLSLLSTCLAEALRLVFALAALAIILS